MPLPQEGPRFAKVLLPNLKHRLPLAVIALPDEPSVRLFE
jgi:hypothetical protein